MAKSKSPVYYTPVQHSGYGYAHKPEFAQGIELRGISKAEAKRVVEAGGILFSNYQTCDDWCDKEMYRNVPDGLVPNAPGTFSTKVVNGLRIYVPGYSPEGSVGLDV